MPHHTSLVVVFPLCMIPLLSVHGRGQTDITNLDGTLTVQYYDSPPGEDYEKLIDKFLQTKYLTFHSSGWIKFRTPGVYVVNRYAIASANDAPTRDPKNWLLQGSNNDSAWATIDSQYNQTFTSRFQRREYAFLNNAAYTYYRLVMTNHSGTILQLSEWEVYGNSVSEVPDTVDITNFWGTIIAQHNDPPIPEEGIASMIDNATTTKYLIPHNTGWVRYKADNYNFYVVTKYTMTSGNDFPERDPRDWILQGSNNTTTWTTLDTRINQVFAARRQELRFTFSNINPYRYYRLEITANNGSASLQLAELKLYGVNVPGGNIPIADFVADKTILMAGDSVAFTNLSRNTTSYRWTFPGGSPATSTERDPTIRYSVDSTYDVTLWVFNGTDSDYVTRSRYISVKFIDTTVIAEQVRQEFLLCWNAYKQYAWGHDELRPLSRSYSDWYAEPFYMTPVDALDTMILMGLQSEADSTREFISTHLSFNKNIFVSNFEFTIRFLGGLLSSYQLTGDQRLLNLGRDLADRELHAFSSSTGMPYGDVNLMTGMAQRSNTNPAEIGTLLLEFGTLSKLTGDTTYYNVAKRALQRLYSYRSSIGLVGDGIDVTSGVWTGTESHITGGIDSYYEYLLKCARLFDDPDCLSMWNASNGAINGYLADSTSTGFWYGHANMYTGMRTSTQFGSLDAFFPAVLALSGDLQRASRLQQSCLAMWNRYTIEPEQLDYIQMFAVSPGYYLRPEIIESAYYLYNYTHDPKYRLMGKIFFDDLRTFCRTPDGYVGLSSVITKGKIDGMPSYFLAETMKYLYLLFAPPDRLDFEHVIFNTEAHPIRKTWGPNSVEPEHGTALPVFRLCQNFPNPFNPATTIRYTLQHGSFVTLALYNTVGQKVAQLANEQQQPGDHEVMFRADALASGVYFYRLTTGGFVQTRKLLFLR